MLVNKLRITREGTNDYIRDISPGEYPYRLQFYADGSEEDALNAIGTVKAILQ